MLIIGALSVVFRVLILVAATACAIALLRWGVLPIVKEIAGEDTTFDFSFVANISLALNVALAGAWGASEVGRRKANKELRASAPPER